MASFHSERLTLREWTEADAPKLFLLNADEEVIRFTGDSPFESNDAALTFIRNYDHYTSHGFGRWGCYLKESCEFIGWCGLRKTEVDGRAEIDLGYRFFKKHWSMGFATESAHASLKYGFEVLKIPRIVAHAMVQNDASIKVMQKLGMEFWRRSTCDNHDAVFYRIDKDSFKNSPLEKKKGNSVTFE